MKPLYHHKNTIDYVNSRAYRWQIDMREVKLGVVTPNFAEFQKTATVVCPDEELFFFYLLEHLMALLSNQYANDEIITDPIHLRVLEEYQTRSAAQYRRMFYYVMVICVREMRHLKSSSYIKATIIEKFGPLAANFFNSLPDGKEAAMKFIKEAPANLTLGNLVEALRIGFYEGSWPSSSYGGKAWGAIADAWQKLIIGEYTPQVFVDVAYTLCHNTGPIFNKGMFYSMYSKDDFTVWLDIQRAGMIPQYILNYPNQYGTVPYSVQHFLKEVKSAFTFEPGYVDWHAVNQYSVSHKGKYKYLMDKQDAKGQSATNIIKTEEPKSYYEVLPGEVYTYKKRKKKKAA